MFFQTIITLLLIAYAESKSSNDSAVNSTIISKSLNVSSVVPANITADGKTYFFRYDSNNQQFRITSRVKKGSEQNHSAPLIDKKHIGNLEKANMNELRKLEAFLDDEWNYSSTKSINTTELPLQIHPFLYKNMLDKAMKKGNSEKLPEVTKIIFNKKNNNSLLLNFHLGNIEEGHHIDNAELHFYWSVPEDSDFYKNSCVLRLYEVAHENDRNAEKNPDTHKLLNVIYVSKAQTGWQMFRINRKSIEKWANMTEKLKMLISLSQANQVNSTTVFDDTENETKWRTFLILKIENEGNDNEENEIAPISNSTSSYKGAHKYCSRKEFYVDFRKLHWSNFIIAPDGFMAYDCYGKCTRHNTESFSNHLKMLSTFQDIDRKIRTPCCVPTKFFSLPVMFYDRFGNVFIKIYKDLVVAKCGCR